MATGKKDTPPFMMVLSFIIIIIIANCLIAYYVDKRVKILWKNCST